MSTVTRSTQQPADGGPETECGCAFVLEEPGRDGEANFCGSERRAGSAYCPTHHALCHLPCDSIAETQHLREIEALAEAVGGKTGRVARHPPPRLLRRLDRIARAFSSPNRSRNVPMAGRDAARR